MFNTSIVILEDNNDLLELYIELLSKIKNTTINGFVNPKEGLNFAITNKPDIIITDNMMPYADGFYVAEKIREVYNPKIILISAFMSKMVQNNQRNYFDICIRKPFNFSQFEELINVFIEDVNNEKLKILDKITNGLLGDINLVGKDKMFIENVIRALMYDNDKPSEDSIYTILSGKLEKDQSTIRRNISKTIEKAYEPSLFERVMGIKKKPKNKEFINKLLERINEKAKSERWD